MKRLAVAIITLLVLFFIGGFISVKYGWISQDLYNQLAAIIGGVSSILGLLSLVLPSFRTSDLKAIEIDALKKLTKTAEEIQERERELSTKQNDIVQLELQKKEIEFLVRKASLSLFFKEQLERKLIMLDELVADNKELSKTINEIKDLESKVEELDVEINKSPNSEKVLQLIETAKKYRVYNIQSGSLLTLPFDLVIEALAKVFLRK